MGAFLHLGQRAVDVDLGGVEEGEAVEVGLWQEEREFRSGKEHSLDAMLPLKPHDDVLEGRANGLIEPAVGEFTHVQLVEPQPLRRFGNHDRRAGPAQRVGVDTGLHGEPCAQQADTRDPARGHRFLHRFQQVDERNG